MIEYVFRPIEKWPRKETLYPRVSPFKAKYEATVRMLEVELKHAGVKGAVVIQLWIKPGDTRIDGGLRADVRLPKQGVILAFTGKYGPVKMPADRFNAWKDNLRAIALSLEALRKVDRYGVTQEGEQYRGWTALPAAAGGMSFDDAAVELNKHAPFVGVDWIKTDVEAFRMAKRAARTKTHPDKGGNAEDFKRVEQAAELLAKHHGVTE